MLNKSQKNKTLKPFDEYELENIHSTDNAQKKTKHYPSSVRIWNNSAYFYNKNNLNLIPSSTQNAMKIIKGFFNLYNKEIESNMRTKRLLLRLRKLSSNRIYLSKGEFKHSNNKVLINIYLFNRQKHNYLFNLKNNFFFKRNIINKNIIKILKLVYFKGLNSIKEANKDNYLLVKALNIIEKNPKYQINSFKNLSNYSMIFYRRLLNLTMKKLRLYFYYKQLIYINKSKLNYNYLRLLKKHLENLYNKNVEFNLINLKRFYLNSDILSESVKLKLSKNKNKMRKILNALKIKIKIQKKKHFLGFNETQEKLINLKASLLRNREISKLKYKDVTGYRLEAKGRLSRRFTAARSVHKLSYKGNLLNIDSSFRGISCVVLKGNLRSNLQFTKDKSKTRIGSYGLKSWISSN